MGLRNYLDKLSHKQKDKVLDALANQARQKEQSAADMQQVQKHLPSAEVEYKHAEKLATMFDRTKRSGAGGTKAGSVGIRPSGGKAASEFLEKYTGQGRYKEPDPLFSKPIPAPTKGIQHQFKPAKVVFPANFCPDCGRTDRPPKLACLNITMMGPAQYELCASVGIDPMDVILSVFCQECMIKAYAAGKVDERNEIAQPILMPNGKIEYETPSQGYSRKRQERIVKHMAEYMRAERVKGDSPIFRKTDGTFHGESI